MNEQQTSSRKEFLKTAGVVAGAAAVATFGFTRAAGAQEAAAGEGPITQIARFGLQEGKAEDAKALLAVLVKGVEEGEPGVLAYIAHISDKTGDVVFFEVYADAAALTAHGTTPHMNEMRTKFATVFKPPVDIERLTKVAGVTR